MEKRNRNPFEEKAILAKEAQSREDKIASKATQVRHLVPNGQLTFQHMLALTYGSPFPTPMRDKGRRNGRRKRH